MDIPLTDKRIKIEEMWKNWDFDGIGKLDGFSIFELRDPKKDTENLFGCVTWLVSVDKDEVERLTSNPESPEGYEEIEEPEEGDLVTYFFHHPMKRLYPKPRSTHNGLYIGNGRVRSKFRESHVYEHPIEDVPRGYGNEVRFFRKL